MNSKEYYQAHKEEMKRAARENYQKNRESLLAGKAKYYKANKEKIDAYKRQWEKDNRERLSAQKKEWKEKNKERYEERMQAYNEKNKEKIAQRQKEYNEKNKESISENKKEYYKENRERILEYKKEYGQTHADAIRVRKGRHRNANKEYFKCYSEKRRALKKGLLATLTPEEWGQTKEKFNNVCCYCGGKSVLTQDHFIPLSKGGVYTQQNIVPACKSCNSSKNSSDFKAWYYKQKFYSQEREEKILKHTENLLTKT